MSGSELDEVEVRLADYRDELELRQAELRHRQRRIEVLTAEIADLEGQRVQLLADKSKFGCSTVQEEDSAPS